jgi:hypothetical protein
MTGSGPWTEELAVKGTGAFVVHGTPPGSIEGQTAYRMPRGQERLLSRVQSKQRRACVGG